MVRSARHIVFGCFLAVMVLGVGFAAIGMFVIPHMAYFQLDAVLSPAELTDPQVRDVTLALLKRAAGNQWLMWTVAGVMLCIVGGIGALVSSRLPTCSGESRSREEMPPDGRRAMPFD